MTEKKLLVQVDNIPGVSKIEVSRIGNLIKILRFIPLVESGYHGRSSVLFSEFHGCENMVAVFDSNSGDQEKFIEIDDYWIYPTSTNPKFAEISYKNTFHSSIIIKKL